MNEETPNRLNSPIYAAHKSTSVVYGGSVTITASWMRPPNFELFDIDRYDINVSSTSGVQQMTTACGKCTNTTVTVAENPRNVRLSTTFTITISARNRCGENGPAATA